MSMAKKNELGGEGFKITKPKNRKVIKIDRSIV